MSVKEFKLLRAKAKFMATKGITKCPNHYGWSYSNLTVRPRGY